MRKFPPSLFLLSLAPLTASAAAADGFSKFSLCAACHGQSGEGTTLGPPLAGSEWVNGPTENLIRIQLHGLQGPITVKGVEHHFAAGMPPLGHQSDEDIAAVLTFIRSSFGNDAPAVTSADVAALRKEVRDKPLTANDLLAPTPAKAATARQAGKYDRLNTSGGLPKWTWIAVLIALVAGGAGFRLWRRS